jgi:hypothetical protein
LLLRRYTWNEKKIIFLNSNLLWWY